MNKTKLVSVHGGHSGSYCGHAFDRLEDLVQRYIDLGFEWVCITEHMPAHASHLIAPEERSQGLGVSELQARFDAYFAQARRLKNKFSEQIEIFIGFETEAYSGYEEAVANLITRHQPDMIVGSVHHVHDLLFDDKVEDYNEAARRSGSIEALYCDYFDKQLELINRFQPAVVDHFDLIRIYDPDYKRRLQVPQVRARALRNLQRIKALDLTLDLNVRAFSKGADEPYPSATLLDYAIAEGIRIAPGDDSHGVDNVGANLMRGAEHLAARGGQTQWRKPKINHYP